MYGMVNQGVREYILKSYGEEVWAKICSDADVQNLEFDRMASYDDAVTYKLVGAISEHTGLSSDDVLRVFGEYWVEFAGRSNFGNLMRLSGSSLVEQLKGLDNMHDRILISMPHLKPPSFELEEGEDGLCQLHYYSEREGLAPMVIGLLYGLANEAGEHVEVKQTAFKSNGEDHDIFEVKLVGHQSDLKTSGHAN